MNRGEEQGQQPVPRLRLVLLGASNIARNFSTMVGICQHVFPAPLDIVIAGGHGRGYGLKSWVLGRTLPPILECGLWDALARRPPLETVTLLTDIGNDLVFGASCEQITTWIEQCLRRLEPLSKRIIMTELPLESVMKLGAVRFRFIRTLLFPRSVLTHGVALQQVQRLNERVVELADRCGAHLVRPQECWYGIDPIHIKRRYKAQAWQTILTAGCAGDRPSVDVSSWSRTWSLCCLRPRDRHLFGIRQTRRQPCATLPDGSLISLY